MLIMGVLMRLNWNAMWCLARMKFHSQTLQKQQFLYRKFQPALFTSLSIIVKLSYSGNEIQRSEVTDNQKDWQSLTMIRELVVRELHVTFGGFCWAQYFGSMLKRKLQTTNRIDNFGLPIVQILLRMHFADDELAFSIFILFQE